MSRPALLPASERGMALLEALIACAIIAAMMGVMYQAMQTHARAAYRLNDQRKAVLVAQSLMARVGADLALAPGETDGTQNGLRWRIEMERYRGEGVSPNDDPALMQIAVTVSPPQTGKPVFTLETLRLAP